MNTIIGVFRDQLDAQEAVNELVAIGLDERQIGVVAKHATPAGGVSPDDATENASLGAATGAAVGLGAGALWGLGIVAGVLPAIGPVIAGGTLVAMAASAATGAAAGGVAGALAGFGFTKEDVHYYENEFSQGRTIVTVHSDRVSEVQQILRKFGAYERDQDLTPAQR